MDSYRPAFSQPPTHAIRSKLQSMSPALAFDLLVAALVGLAVGLEREWSGHATGPDARFAGLRTFAMLGAIGGVSGWLLRVDQPLAALCFVAGTVLFIVVAYASTMRRPTSTVDGTTEVAAILVVAFGLISGLGNRTMASAGGALLLVLLAEKSAFQKALHRIGAAELRATLQFAVLALVVLPLLPTGEYGPYGAFQPRQLWTVVLLFSGLSFAGYLARRLVGESRGLGITGLLGGLVSSTAVTLSFSRRSRLEPTVASALAFGVTAACSMLLLRVLVLATVLQPSLFTPLLPLLGPPLLVGALLVVIGFWRDPLLDRRTATHAAAAGAAEGRATESGPRADAITGGKTDSLISNVTNGITNGMANPLALSTSIQMAVAFQLVLFIVAWVQDTVGDPGVLVSAALLGLTDVDALTLSMTRLAGDAAQTQVASLAIAIGVIANTALKLFLAILIGAPSFRSRAAIALLILGGSSAVALWWRW